MRSLLSQVAIAIFASTAFAQAQKLVVAPKSIAEVNYRPGGKLIYVQAWVNGSEPLWFILDSGAPDSLIDTATARRLNVRAVSEGRTAQAKVR